MQRKELCHCKKCFLYSLNITWRSRPSLKKGYKKGTETFVWRTTERTVNFWSGKEIDLLDYEKALQNYKECGENMGGISFLFLHLNIYWASDGGSFNAFRKIRSSAKGQQFIIFITTIIGTIDLCVCLRTKTANAIEEKIHWGLLNTQ